MRIKIFHIGKSGEDCFQIKVHNTVNNNDKSLKITQSCDKNQSW